MSDITPEEQVARSIARLQKYAARLGDEGTGAPLASEVAYLLSAAFRFAPAQMAAMLAARRWEGLPYAPLTDGDLCGLAVVLARMWQYPDGMAWLIRDDLRLAMAELADPAKRAAAEAKAAVIGLRAQDN